MEAVPAWNPERTKAGSIGARGMPGSDEWDLGRFWSHTYASRVFPAAYDGPYADRVFLLTRSAVYVEYADADGDGVYETRRPESDYRTLERVESGWTLTDLDGTVEHYGADGTWRRKVDRAGNATVGTYEGGRLARVGFPDGRSETFHYDAGGDLVRITEIGVGGAASRSWHYTWEGQDLVRVDRPDGTAFEYRYDDPRHPGYMTRTTLVGSDSMSRRITAAWEYDDVGNAVRMWRGAEAFENGVDAWELRFDDPELPTVTTYVDPFGDDSIRRWAERHSRHEKARLVQVEGECPTCGLDPSSVLEYGDPQNPYRPTKEVDGNGTVTLYSYDEYGRMTSRTEAFATPLERLTRWEYHDVYPALTTLREEPSTYPSALKRTLWDYDARGLLVARTEEGIENDEAFSYTTRTTRTPEGHQASIDPPGFEVPGNTDVVTFTYDPDRGGQVVISRTDPLVGTTRYGYDAFNRRTSVIDVNGVETVTEYDAADRVTAVIQKGATSSEDLVTRYVYDVFGELDYTVLPEGNVVDYDYDSAGRLVSIERRPDLASHGERTVYTLDDLGRRVREDLQSWNGSSWGSATFTEFVYSSRCFLDQIAHPDGTVEEMRYDCEGNLAAEWDENHPSADHPPTSEYTYDALDRLVRLRQPWGGAGGGVVDIRYGYNIQDQLTRVVDGNGTVTEYEYGDRGLLTMEISEVSGITRHRYDPHGNAVQKVDARDIYVERKYDALDRLTDVLYPDPSYNTKRIYDDPAIPFSKGRLTSIQRHGDSVDYAYDRFGRMIQDGDLGLGYDRNGNRTLLEYPGGVIATYTFDFADREKSLTVDWGEGPTAIVSDAEYLPSGPLTRLERGNGMTELREYDNRYHPARIFVDGVIDWVYETDAVGNPLTITDGLDGSGNRVYGYQDVQYYLTRGDGPWGELSWTYDRLGNRLTETRDGVTREYSYRPNAAGNASPVLASTRDLETGEVVEYRHDVAGNLILERGATDATVYRYDVEGRLAEMRFESASHPGSVTSVTYDSRSFLRLSHFDHLPSREGPSGSTTATYSSPGILYGIQSESHPDLSSSRNAGPNNLEHSILYLAEIPVAQLEVVNQSAKYFVADHLGTPVTATTSIGETVWSGGFEPFGVDWKANSAQASSILLRLPGQWSLPRKGLGKNSDLYYNVFRWYGPQSGRYSRPDPLGIDENAWSLYAYSSNNPLFYQDANGLVALAPGNECKGFDKARRKLQKLKDDCACTKHFEEVLGADLPRLIDGPMPKVKIKKGPGSASTQCKKDPGTIWIDPLFCQFGYRGKLPNIILHELAHYADCKRQNFPPGGPVEEGAEAERACFGTSLDSKVK